VLRVRHQPDHVPRGVRDARDVARRTVRVLAGGVAEHDATLSLELVEHGLVGDEAALAVLDRQHEALPGRVPELKGVAVRSTRMPTGRLTKRSRSLRSSAPGSRRASHSTWNPLQIPSTGPPSAAKRATARMMGARCATAPQRR
jgi:hypothetical protein